MVHLAILTLSLPSTTFADVGLNCRVRDGIGCFPNAIDTPNSNFIFQQTYTLNIYIKQYQSGAFTLTKQDQNSKQNPCKIEQSKTTN